MALAIDTGATASNFSGSVGNQLTVTLTTSSPNEMVILFIGADGPGTNDGDVTSVSGGVSWNKDLSSNAVLLGSGGFGGLTSIWHGFANSVVSGQTVTITFSSSAVGPRWAALFAFTGSDSVVGATARNGGASGAPSQNLITTRDNSWVWGVIWDWSNNVTPVLGSNQTQQAIVNDSTGGDAGWVQSQTNVTPSSGTTVTINDTSPTTDNWNLVMVEILPAIVVPSTPAMGFESDFQWLGGDWR